MKKALLVIDMYNVCIGENHATYFKYNNTDLVEAVNKVIGIQILLLLQTLITVVRFILFLLQREFKREIFS